MRYFFGGLQMFARWTVRILLFWLPPGLRDAVVFETVSSLCHRLPSRMRRPAGPLLINLGSGAYILEGFVNVDFYSGLPLDCFADLRRPLKIPAGAADGILTEHTLEHLSYADNRRLLKECHRVMKDGATIRIIVPDVGMFAKALSENNRAFFEAWEREYFIDSASPERASRRLRSPIEALSFVTQEYGHRSCWDRDLAMRLLTEAGFSDIAIESYRHGRNPPLLMDRPESDRRLVSLYVEATKALGATNA